MRRLLCPSFPGKEGIIAHWFIEEGAPLCTDGSPRPIVAIQIGDIGSITIMMVKDPPLSLVLKEQSICEGESLRPGDVCWHSLGQQRSGFLMMTRWSVWTQ